MDAEFVGRGNVVKKLKAGIDPHLDIEFDKVTLGAITTSILVHFYYKKKATSAEAKRELQTIFVLALPHAILKPRYNPTPDITFFGEGKHSPARGEVPRIRVYFTRLKQMCQWRLQELQYDGGVEYTKPIWRDADPDGTITLTPFHYIPRASR